MVKRFLFVGEKPSKKAFANGWTWRDGKLAAKSLFDALQASNIDPRQCGFVNAFCDHPGKPDERDIIPRMRCLRAAADSGATIVALGLRVSKLLCIHDIPHVTLRHPAARGSGRSRPVYAAHVKDILEASPVLISLWGKGRTNDTAAVRVSY